MSLARIRRPFRIGLVHAGLISRLEGQVSQVIDIDADTPALLRLRHKTTEGFGDNLMAEADTNHFFALCVECLY